MGMTKTKKAIMDLQERVNTVENNEDLIKRAVSEEEWEATKQCADEIKTVLEAYEKQKEFVRNSRKKVINQKNKIKQLEQNTKKLKEVQGSEANI